MIERTCLTVMMVIALAGGAMSADRPNVILCMTDDQGWGDTGYNGHPVLKTPHLDVMAGEGMRFDRFYSSSPVCSPTRGSCLTGRHPYRYGITFANVGHLKKQELTLAEVLKEKGYATGHFGKWHLGTLTPDYSGKGAGRKPAQNYAPPGLNGFDEWFSTEYAVATWDPYDPANTHGGRFDVRNVYWHNGTNVAEGLSGCDSRIIMDKTIPFIRGAVAGDKPFFAVIWFHAPHSPVVGGPEYRAMYPDQDENHQHYYGCITAVDEQMGRLRKELDDLGVAENTMLWFCSDNGPARQGSKRHVGSPGPYRGFKTSLYEGGVRVPGLLVWPAKIREPRVVTMPCVTSDYFPTVLAALGHTLQGEPRPYDGVNLMPLIEGEMSKRSSPIGFQSGNQATFMEGKYKLVVMTPRRGRDRKKTETKTVYELYDLDADPSEARDLAEEQPERVAELREKLEAWQASCRASNAGGDYGVQEGSP